MRLLSPNEAQNAARKEEEIVSNRINELKREMTTEVRRLDELKAGIEQAKACLTDELAQVRRQADTDKEVILGEIRVLEAKRTAIAESVEEKRWQERHNAIELREIEHATRTKALVTQEEELNAKARELASKEADLEKRDADLDEKQRVISLQSQANQIILDSLERQTEEMRKETAKLEAYRASIKGTFDEAKHDLLTNAAYKK